MDGTEGGQGAGRACTLTGINQFFGSPALNWRVKANKAGIWGYMRHEARVCGVGEEKERVRKWDGHRHCAGVIDIPLKSFSL